ncbi:hypothetical protein QBC44DRAFT_327900 [Cladorrhinum sp. PSN332]|nr:hypothetical protein QBC44DRAFT_327900 [Cladorrhinum sp. PSN332]
MAAAAPLSPTPSAALNVVSTPSNPNRESAYHHDFAMSTGNNNMDNNNDDHSPNPLMNSTPRGPSPPAVTSTKAAAAARPGSRIISGSELSPLKILQQSQITQAQQTMEDLTSPASTTTQPAQQTTQHRQKLSASTNNSMAPPPVPLLNHNNNNNSNSPRKAPTIKRFPVRVSGSSSESSSPVRRQSNESRQDTIMHDSLHSTTSSHEEGLKKRAIEIFEDEDDEDDDKMDVFDDHNHNNMNGDGGGGGGPGTKDQDNDHMMMMEDHSAADDTVMSTFSTFSAVPNLTMLANMRSESPTKSFGSSVGPTPSRGRSNGPAPDRSGTHQLYDTGNGNNANLMDFTEQLRFERSYHNGQATPSSRRGISPNFMAAGGGGGNGNNNNNLANLLDFDIPPMPTPRSIPSITPRELESLKSGFLSEISSLKASLSGKEAEVLSLKTAVGDAEKRVGECLEQLREVESVQEALTSEKDNWERRGREMEAVLRKVKEEIVLGQREREELEFKLDEAEKRREAAEMMAQDAESKMAGMRAGKAAGSHGGGDATSPTGGNSNKEVEMAVERVARELHALYKSKHETKVAALKKSYETRWEKKVRELQGQVDELARENDELRRSGGGGNGRNGVDQARIAELEEERRVERAQNAAHIRELQAESQKLEAILKTVQADNADLRVLLERERVEKGELVQLAEEMMNMQQSFIGGSSQAQEQEQPEPEPEPEPVREPVRRSFISPEPEMMRRRPSPPMPAPVKELSNGARTPARRQSSSIGSFGAGGGNGGRTPISVRSSMPPPSRTMELSSSNENAAPPPTGNNFRMSVNGGSGGAPNFRASGLRAPGSGIPGSKPSMIGRGGPGSQHGKSNSVAGALPRPGSVAGSRGLMGSIEKMGAGGSGGSSGYGMRSSRYGGGGGD